MGLAWHAEIKKDPDFTRLIHTIEDMFNKL
jgi:hypothetical protein